MQTNRAEFTPFFGQPTEEQLEKIRALQPAGSEPLAATEVVVVSLVIADNFVRRDGWHSLSPNSLGAMKRRLPGSHFTRDHDTRLSSKVTARLFDTRITITDEVSEEFMNLDGHGEANKQIFRNQGGYIQLWGDIYVDAKSSQVKRMRFGKDAELSYHGAFLGARMVCSNCTCSDSDGIWGAECPMLESGVPWERYLSEDELAAAQISAYEMLDADGFDPYETSWVVVPAYARAGTVRNTEM